MKRTYINRLPKKEEVKNTNVRIENGKLIVEVDFKDKFEPKDGDFLCVNGDCFIYNGKQSKFSYGAHVGVMSASKRIATGITDNSWSEKENCRYATPEEKAAFLERLEKEYGKRWNAEKKYLEDIRWRAEKDCTYYYVDERGNVLGCNDTRGCASDSRYLCGNYFKTREAARPYADQIKEIFKNSKAE